jgi:membrane-associated phospholipid phosphatase
VSTSDSLLAPLTRARAYTWTSHFPRLRLSERLVLGYFLYTLILAVMQSAHSTSWKSLGGVAFVATGIILPLAWTDQRFGGKFFSIVRDWLPTPFVLVAYWTIDWLPHSAYQGGWERYLVAWDRTLLDTWGIRAMIESSGSFLPGLLEFSYSLLYAVPPFCLAILYLCHRRIRVDSFLFLFLSGTLLAYALLPHFPLQGPRTAFPSEDLPNITTPCRSMNQWLLDRYDIHTSVFPSGHVAVGFSAAFAMLLVLPERRWIGATLLAIALAVALATVYGRYHYAADGLAAAVTSAGAVAVAVFCCPAIVARKGSQSEL